MPELPPDVLQLVFQELVGDYEALLNVSLTCSAWRSLAQPSVYRVVDISSHNNGRQPQLECEMRPLVYADYDGEFRPQNLVSRQRAFLRRMMDEPQLARYVRSFTWTLIWLDFDEDDLTEIDHQTWDVFGRMTNVTYLDLASLHRNDDDGYIRQNPTVLFPKVRILRLLGWMHRGLVRAIVTSLDPRKLESLRLDYLEDEGAFPNGESLGKDSALRLAHHTLKAGFSQRIDPNRATKSSDIYHNDLIIRQETGKAFIFPGPMWLPLYLLSAHSMTSLSHLEVKVPLFSIYTDFRSYHTLFQQTADFAIKVRENLKSLVIVFGESQYLYKLPTSELRMSGCMYDRRSYEPWCIAMAKNFLEQMLAALNGNAFPRLESMRFEGFSLLVNLLSLNGANPQKIARAGLTGVFQSIENSRFADGIFTDISSRQGRESYRGHDRRTNGDRRFEELLAGS